MLQLRAIGAAADHVKAIATELILTFAPSVGDIFEDDQTIVAGSADPGELRLPIVDALDKSGERAVTHRVGNVDLDFVSVVAKPKI
jgi:hypothetical protein